MRDLIDFYLKRNIKNWANLQHPDKFSRGRLLNAAENRQWIVARDLKEIRASKKREKNQQYNYYTFHPLFAYQTSNAFAETRLWLLHSTPLRMHC